ncbi:hypothetical protein AURDEDRAFT_186935 [Auricularia subglabra TFB-10046 SS5]|nr:hypothetical protein AURDEDRAFT_186935 [Auricularia subglabra TFB-10046 SS5]
MICDSARLDRRLQCVRTLSSVCATWRQCVIEDTRFWTQIHVSGYEALYDLRYALPRSRTRPVEIGVDLSALPNATVTEQDCQISGAILGVLDTHLDRVFFLALVLDARLFDAMHSLRSPAGSLEQLTISIRNADAAGVTSARHPRLLSRPMPNLARLSVYGLPFSTFRTALGVSLRVVEFDPGCLHYDEFMGLFRACAIVEDVCIRNLCIYTWPDETAPPTSIVAVRLRSLRMEGILSDPPGDARIVTATALSMLPMDTIQTIALNTVTGRSVLAEATACFQTLGSLRALVFSRETIEDEWKSVSITATTPRGTERRLHVFILDIDVSQFVSMTRGVGGTHGRRTVRDLSLPVDWVETFLLHTDLTLCELQTLTLTYNLGYFYPRPDPQLSPAGTATSCALLEEVILNVPDTGVLPDIMPLFNQAMASIIAFGAAPHPATLVLSRSFTRAAQTEDIGLDELKSQFGSWKTL